jgi:streptomycin 6-kinase
LTVIEIHEQLHRTIEQFGDDGRNWLARLPDVIARLEETWRIDVGATFGNASVSYTAPATRRDGGRVVIKVPIPHEEAEHEPDALRLWDGRGAVRLIELDDATGAMLLEACRPGTRLSDAAEPDDVSAIGGALLRELHRPLPSIGLPFRRLNDVMQRWADLARARVRTIGDPADTALVDEGAELLERLPDGSDTQTLLHGDYHHWNVLRAEREPWLAIDPKPMVGDPAYDSAQFLGNRYGTRGPDHFEGELARFSAAAGFDEHRVLLWCYARETENCQWYISVNDREGANGSVEYARFLRRILEDRGGIR